MTVSFRTVDEREGIEVVGLGAYLDNKGALETGLEIDTSESGPGPSEGGVNVVIGFIKLSFGSGVFSVFSILKEVAVSDDGISCAGGIAVEPKVRSSDEIALEPFLMFGVAIRRLVIAEFGSRFLGRL